MSSKITRDQAKKIIHDYIAENGLEIVEKCEEQGIELVEILGIAPKQFGMWTVINGKFIGYIYNFGLENWYRKEDFSEDFIEKQKLYIEIKDLNMFLDLLTPGYLERVSKLSV